MHTFDLGLLIVAGGALVLGLLSRWLKLHGIPDAITLLLVGVAVGPVGFGWFIPDQWGQPMAVLEQVARLSLAIGLMGVALRLPKNYVVHHWRSLLLVLGLGMPFMWLTSSVLIQGIMGVSMTLALLLGAIITPTDPVVASSLITGPVADKTLPAYLRRIISGESGANDGLGFLFVMGASFPFIDNASASLTVHLLDILFSDVLSAIAMGIVIGYGAGFLLRKAEDHHLIEHSSILMFTTALAFSTLAAVELMGSNGILAVFVAGLAFDQQVDVNQRHEEEYVVEGYDRFFTSPVFLLLGLMIPWQAWMALGWAGVALVVSLLLLRRLPLFLLLGGHSRDLPCRRDGAFSGWFGPIGVAALYYVALAHHHASLTPLWPQLWPIVSLLVVASIFVHGLTATPFSRLYHRLSELARR